MKSSALTMSIVCWTGRLLALGLVLFWGAFFVEHLQQWFLHPVKGFPPVWVWLGQLAHLVILIGLMALWRWPVIGSIFTLPERSASSGSGDLSGDCGKAVPFVLGIPRRHDHPGPVDPCLLVRSNPCPDRRRNPAHGAPIATEKKTRMARVTGNGLNRTQVAEADVPSCPVGISSKSAARTNRGHLALLKIIIGRYTFGPAFAVPTRGRRGPP